MDMNKVLLPGEHPLDTRKPNTDQVGHALERLQTFLIWVDEHRRSFEKESATPIHRVRTLNFAIGEPGR